MRKFKFERSKTSITLPKAKYKNMHQLLGDKKPAFQATLNHLLKELTTLRTGRANPVIIENIKIVAYESTMDLKSTASISVPDAQTLIVDPWDKSLLQTIDKAIRDADNGLSPAIDGSIVRINMPPMTEDNRKKIVKTAKGKLEEAKVGIRSVREGTREQVTKLEREGEVSEDEKFRILEELDDMTKRYQIKADDMFDKKKDEIMKI